MERANSKFQGFTILLIVGLTVFLISLVAYRFNSHIEDPGVKAMNLFGLFFGLFLSVVSGFKASGLAALCRHKAGPRRSRPRFCLPRVWSPDAARRVSGYCQNALSRASAPAQSHDR